MVVTFTTTDTDHGYGYLDESTLVYDGSGDF